MSICPSMCPSSINTIFCEFSQVIKFHGALQMAYSLFFPVLQGLSEIQAKHSYLKIILKSLINRNDSITHRLHSKCVCYMQTQTGSRLVPFAPGDSVTDSTAFKSSCDSPSFLEKKFSGCVGGIAVETKS